MWFPSAKADDTVPVLIYRVTQEMLYAHDCVQEAEQRYAELFAAL